MENTIYCNNFATELKYLLHTEYENCKVVIVTNNYLLQKFNKKISELSEVSVRIKIVTLPSFACNNKLFLGQLLNELEEDVKLIIGLGGGNLCDLVKSAGAKFGLSYILVPTACSSGGYGLNSFISFNDGFVDIIDCFSPKAIIVDQEIISQTPNKMLASCYGEIMGTTLTILDAVFLKATKKANYSTQLLLKLEKLIAQTSTYPTNILKTPFGKIQLFKTYLELNEMLNELNLNYASIFLYRNLTVKFLNRQVSYGATIMVCSLILGALFKQFFSVKLINANCFPNVENRVNKLKTIMQTKPVSFLKTLDYNVQKNVQDLNLVKDICLKLSENYNKIIANSYNVFKNLHNDKAIYLQKLITKGAMVNALCMTPDVYINNNLLTAIRNTGMLELNV